MSNINNDVTNFISEVQKSTKLDLDISTACYYETDWSYLDDFIASKYDSSSSIETIPIRFFQNFINNQANCYKNPFERVLSGQTDMIDENVLNHSLLWVERFNHVHKQSLLYIENPTTYQCINASNYEKKDGEYYFKSGDKHIKINETGVYEKVNPSEIEGEINDEYKLLRPLKGTMPIVEYGYEGIEYPQANDLVSLQYNCIADVSWAIHNAAVKLLSQPVVNTNEPENEIKNKLRGYGRTSKMLKIGTSDSIKMVDVGNLQNMNDVYSLYDKIIQQQAVRKGVDKFAVSIINSIQSGEAIKVQLSYINQIRMDFIPLYTKKEYEIFKILREIFNVNVELVSITFPPLSYAY